MYAITIATGNVSSQVAEALLSAGHKVRAIGRSAERLDPLVQKGAQAFVGSVDDAAAMEEAFTGAQAVFSVIPPDFTVDDYHAFQTGASVALTSAIANAGVQHVVNLSSIGAERPDRLGVVNGLHDNELRMNELDGVNVLHLRPALFMDSLLYGLPMIKQAGMVGGTLIADLAVPMIAAGDVAAISARALLDLDFSGTSTQDVLGHADITMNEVAAAFGSAIGKPDLGYVQISEQDVEAAMVSMGLAAEAARVLNELFRGVNEGVYKPSEERSAANSTPTSISQFAEQVFAPAYLQ